MYHCLSYLLQLIGIVFLIRCNCMKMKLIMMQRKTQYIKFVLAVWIVILSPLAISASFALTCSRLVDRKADLACHGSLFTGGRGGGRGGSSGEHFRSGRRNYG